MRGGLTRVPVIINAYNSTQISLIVERIGQNLQPGDEVAVVNGNGGHTFDRNQLHGWVRQLRSSLPEAVTLSHHTSGLSNVVASAGDFPPACNSILYDFEPNFESEFSWVFADALDCFRKFSSTCHQIHRQAVGYPSGRAILERDLAAYRWDYGQLRGCVDKLVVQTQHWARVGQSEWNYALTQLQSQFARRGMGPEQIFPQISIGNGPNAVDMTLANALIEDARRRGVGGLYLWWSPDIIGDLVRVLA